MHVYRTLEFKYRLPRPRSSRNSLYRLARGEKYNSFAGSPCSTSLRTLMMVSRPAKTKEIRTLLELRKVRPSFMVHMVIHGIEDNSLCSYCGQNDSIIHTFLKCHWTQLFFLEVIKWFNVQNVTSFSLSPSELIFEIKTGSKKQNTFKINKKLNYTILFAKYYLYTQKLSLRELSLNEFIVKFTWRYDLQTLNRLFHGIFCFVN